MKKIALAVIVLAIVLLVLGAVGFFTNPGTEEFTTFVTREGAGEGSKPLIDLRISESSTNTVVLGGTVYTVESRDYHVLSVFRLERKISILGGKEGSSPTWIGVFGKFVKWSG